MIFLWTREIWFFAQWKIKVYFCLVTIFSLSFKIFSQTEINILEKGLEFVPTPNMISEADLRRDFKEFSRKIRCKWYLRDEPFEEFSEIPAFRPKSTWKPPAGDPCVELFLSKMEQLFSFLPGKPQSYNLAKEERQAWKNLKDDRSIIIKPADKGNCVVVWNREDYLTLQLNDESIYVDLKYSTDKTLPDLIKKSNNFFKRSNKKKIVSEKELKYFSYSFKNASCLKKCIFYLKFINGFTMSQDVLLYQIVAPWLRKYHNFWIIISNQLWNQENRMWRTLESS